MFEEANAYSPNSSCLFQAHDIAAVETILTSCFGVEPKFDSITFPITSRCVTCYAKFAVLMFRYLCLINLNRVEFIFYINFIIAFLDRQLGFGNCISKSKNHFKVHLCWFDFTKAFVILY